MMNLILIQMTMLKRVVPTRVSADSMTLRRASIQSPASLRSLKRASIQFQVNLKSPRRVLIQSPVNLKSLRRVLIQSPASPRSLLTKSSQQTLSQRTKLLITVSAASMVTKRERTLTQVTMTKTRMREMLACPQRVTKTTILNSQAPTPALMTLMQLAAS